MKTFLCGRCRTIQDIEPTALQAVRPQRNILKFGVDFRLSIDRVDLPDRPTRVDNDRFTMNHLGVIAGQKNSRAGHVFRIQKIDTRGR